MVKICLIDDDQTMITLLRTFLGLEGYEVLSLGEPGQYGQVLGVLRQELPALALIDVNLRVINGFDLLDDIRRDPVLGAMRVVMSSGMDFQEKCLQVGADGFLMKPYMPEDLIEIIKKLLGPDP